MIARLLTEHSRALDLETPDEDELLSKLYATERSTYFVMERDSCIVGGAGVAPIAKDLRHIAELQRFVLKPMRARIGHGIRLLKECLEAADLLEYRACYAESFSGDADLNEMLQRVGFRVFGNSLLKPTTLGCDAIHYFKLGLR